MITDAGDIIDRLVIFQLKMERIGDPVYKRAFREYLHELFVLFVVYPEVDWWSFILESLNYNKEVWRLESSVRQGKMENDAEKVKQKTAEIREWNKKRIDVKNRINELTSEGFKETKKDHLSQ